MTMRLIIYPPLRMSASIGSAAPQRSVWTLVMALHTGPKLVLAAMNRSVCSAATCHVSRDKRGTWEGLLTPHLAPVTSLLALAELTSLMMVTVVPSVELYTIHILATGVFLVCSGLHMSLSCYIVR